MSEKEFDLICIGRSCVDLYSGESGVPVQRAMTFDKSLGGSPMNIAIGTSRLGLKVGAITAVGEEDNGRFLKWQLACEGVDVSNIKTDPKRLTAMVLLSIRGDNEFQLIQYRENCSDMGLSPDDIDPEYLARAKAVLVTGVHLSGEVVRATTHKILRLARELGLTCIFDIDYRPNLWGLQGHDSGSSRWAEASERITKTYQEVLPYVDLIVGTEEEYFILGGKTAPMEALREVRARSAATLVFKLGDQGCAVFPDAIPDSFKNSVIYHGFPVKVFNSVGAGDGFMSGFLRGWLRGEDYETSCRYANAAGAFAVSRLGCSSSYPSWEELSYFLEHGSPHKWLREDVTLEQIHWATNRRRTWKNLAILAMDHREILEQLARDTGKSPDDIRAFKKLVFQALREAIPQLENGIDPGILLDDTYGRELLFETNNLPVWVGRAVEKTGCSPLRFEGWHDVGITLKSWPENHTVKCLFQPGLHDAPDVVEENERQLCRLVSGARGTGHDLLMELIPDQHQPPRDQDASLLYWIRRCYELGVYPDYWKILPPFEPETWQALESIIQTNDPYCRGILVLGFNVAEDELVKSFNSIPRSSRALGFAIGRSIFLKPAEQWFAESITDEEATASIRDCFLRLTRAWNARGNE